MLFCSPNIPTSLLVLKKFSLRTVRMANASPVKHRRSARIRAQNAAPADVVEAYTPNAQTPEALQCPTDVEMATATLCVETLVPEPSMPTANLPEKCPPRLSRLRADPYKERRENRRESTNARLRGVLMLGSFAIVDSSSSNSSRSSAEPAVSNTQPALEASATSSQSAEVETRKGQSPAIRAPEYDPQQPAAGLDDVFMAYDASPYEVTASRQQHLEYDPLDPVAGMAEAEWRYRSFEELGGFCVRLETMRPNPRSFPDPFW